MGSSPIYSLNAEVSQLVDDFVSKAKVCGFESLLQHNNMGLCRNLGRRACLRCMCFESSSLSKPTNTYGEVEMLVFVTRQKLGLFVSMLFNHSHKLLICSNVGSIPTLPTKLKLYDESTITNGRVAQLEDGIRLKPCSVWVRIPPRLLQKENI